MKYRKTALRTLAAGVALGAVGQGQAIEVFGPSAQSANDNASLVTQVVVRHGGGGGFHGGGGHYHAGGGYHGGGAYHGGYHAGGAYHGGGYGYHGGGVYHGGGYGYHGGGVYHGGGYAWRNYGWAPGGAIAAGAAIGFLTAASVAAWAPAAPQPGLCWYYTDASQRNGFWDACP
jgi:hypothetical protein